MVLRIWIHGRGARNAERQKLSDPARRRGWSARKGIEVKKNNERKTRGRVRCSAWLGDWSERESRMLMWQALRHRGLSLPPRTPPGKAPAAWPCHDQCTLGQMLLLQAAQRPPEDRVTGRAYLRHLLAVLPDATKRLWRRLVDQVLTYTGAKSPNL